MKNKQNDSKSQDLLRVSRGIISNKGNKFAKRVLAPVIAICLDDLNFLSKMLNFTSNEAKSMLWGVDKSYFYHFKKTDGKSEIHDSIALPVLYYFNKVYNLFPNDLPRKIIEHLCWQRGLTIESPLFKELYGSLACIKDLDCKLYNRQSFELRQLMGVSIKGFSTIFISGEVPAGITTPKISDFAKKAVISNHKYTGGDQEAYRTLENEWPQFRTLRLWLALGIHYGLINREEIHAKLAAVSEDDAPLFSELREELHQKHYYLG